MSPLTLGIYATHVNDFPIYLSEHPQFSNLRFPMLFDQAFSLYQLAQLCFKDAWGNSSFVKRSDSFHTCDPIVLGMLTFTKLQFWVHLHPSK